MDRLVQAVEKWSKDRDLHKADSSKQFLKVIEEIGEVADALAKDKPEELKDGIGDTIVTLIILAQQNGLTLEECLQTAYNEIADRKGEVVNGVFIKEEDLSRKETDVKHPFVEALKITAESTKDIRY